jgi:Fe-S-cluster containining protein
MSTYCIDCAKQGNDCCRSDFSKFTTLRDAERIAEFLGEDIDTFTVYRDVRPNDKEVPAYQIRDTGYYYSLMHEDGRLLQLKSKSDGSCIFHDECGRCRIYPARPLICRTYPFWYMDTGEIKFDSSSEDCQIVEAVAGDGDPAAVVLVEHRNDSQVRCALEYIGHNEGSMKSLLAQMKSEIADYHGRIQQFLGENWIEME